MQVEATPSTEATPASAAIQEFPCRQCGAKLTFKPGTQLLQCPYCGHSEAIATTDRPIVEYDLSEGLARLRTVRAQDLVNNGFEVQCAGCGARAVVDKLSDHCAFCGSPRIAPLEATEDSLMPESLLPFAIDQRAATASFRKWVASRWLAPNDLAKRARQQGMDGVYVPFWTYDSQTSTRYSGERGDHYWVNETYTDPQGRTQTRRVMKTRWRMASGTVQVPFDDVLVCASKALPRPLVQSLEPWDLTALLAYQPHYLSGFTAERYAVSLQDGFELAEARMEPVIDGSIRRDIGGDVQRIHQKHIQHRQTTFKHLLLPLWISSFRYGEKVYRVIVNARTGETAGERPWSAAKITLLVIFGLLLLAAIVYVVMRYR